MLDIKTLIQEHQDVFSKLSMFAPTLNEAAEKMVEAIKKGGKIFWLGNGGSAADAQHMAAELVGRFKKERKAIASLALSTDTSILTALSNDYHFNMIFARQLEALCQPNDVVIALSTSGNSENILSGIAQAKAIGAYTIGFTGHQGGKLKGLVDLCFVIPSTTTARIQEAHTFLCHALCESVEDQLV